MPIDQCEDDTLHSVTSAPTNLVFDNNSTWSDAYMFGREGDTTWSFINQAFEMDVQFTPYDAVPLLTLATANGRIIVDDVIQRVLHFNVDPATVQASLRPGTYVYDLVMIDESNPSPPAMRTLLMHGKLTLTQGVTYP